MEKEISTRHDKLTFKKCKKQKEYTKGLVLINHC